MAHYDGWPRPVPSELVEGLPYITAAPVTGEIDTLGMKDARRKADYWNGVRLNVAEADCMKGVKCAVDVRCGLVGTDEAHAAGEHPDCIAVPFADRSYYYENCHFDLARAQGLFVRQNQEGYFAEHGPIPGLAVIGCTFPRHVDWTPGATKPRSNSQILYSIEHLVIRDTVFDFLIVKHDKHHPCQLYNVEFENVRCRKGWYIDPSIIPDDSPLRDELIFDPDA